LGPGAFHDFKVAPPGWCTWVNIEYLASVVMERDGVAYPDTCVGPRTTMENGPRRLG
jgi:aconitate hydratase